MAKRRRSITKTMLRRKRAAAIKMRKRSDKIIAQMVPLPTFDAFVDDAAKAAEQFARKSHWSKIVECRHDLRIDTCDRMVASLQKLTKDADRTISRLQSSPPPATTNPQTQRKLK